MHPDHPPFLIQRVFRNKKTLALSLAVATVGTLILQMPLMLKAVTSLPLQIKQTGKTNYKISFSSLANESLYFFHPNTTGLCTLSDATKTLLSNGSFASKEVDSTFLSGTIPITTSTTKTVDLYLNCSEPFGSPWAAQYEATPSITTPKLGRALALLHQIRLHLLGPVFSFILLIVTLLIGRISSTQRKSNGASTLFAAAAFIYSTINSNILLLFSTSEISIACTALSRGLFSAAFIYLCQTYSESKTWLLPVNIISAFLMATICYVNPTYGVKIYTVNAVAIYVMSSGIVAYDLLGNFDKSIKHIQVASLVWLFMQIEASALAALKVTSFYSNGFIAISAISLIYFILREKVATETRINSQKIELASTLRLNEIAEQVAHDIRAPVSALKILLNSSNIHPDEQFIIDHATSRIIEISEQLLKQRKSPFGMTPLTHAVESIVQEKRIQYSPYKSLKIDLIQPKESAPAVQCNESDLKRIISNLIDNSVEATQHRGAVQVTIETTAHFVTISISDNGPGIPTPILKELGKKGTTFGKENGNGLGIYYAQTTIESWGGSLSIESSHGTGATFTLSLSRLPRDS